MSKKRPSFKDGIGIGHIFKNDGRLTCRYCGRDFVGGGRHRHDCPTQNSETEVGRQVEEVEYKGSDGGYDRY